MITTWITTLITFLIGYALGVHSQAPEKTAKVIRKVKRKVGKGGRVGGITKLTAQEQRIRSNPNLKGEEEAMGEIFDDVLQRPR